MEKKSLFSQVFCNFWTGNVACLGQALEENKKELPTWRGHHETNMALTGIAYSRAKEGSKFLCYSISWPLVQQIQLQPPPFAMSNRIPKYYFYRGYIC